MQLIIHFYEKEFNFFKVNNSKINVLIKNEGIILKLCSWLFLYANMQEQILQTNNAVSTRHKAQSLSTEREQRVSDSAKFLHCRKMKQGIGGKKKNGVNHTKRLS